jgi:hypothetical protein
MGVFLTRDPSESHESLQDGPSVANPLSVPSSTVALALSVRSATGFLAGKQPKSPEEKTRLNRRFGEEDSWSYSEDT